MAAWTNYLTRRIGKKAHEIFSSEIVFDDGIADIEIVAPLNAEKTESIEEAKSLEFYKIKALSNLMKVDGKSEEEELEFLSSMIESSALSAEDKLSLISDISSTDSKLDGINAIAASPADAIALITDMVALAKVDGKFHITEKMYIKQVGKILGFDDADINEMINS
ncbi:TerB family tellurite resistance protein [Pseudomonas spirodelae]|uniref:TerB family tellurite resistance protein n=1 Tax=Pseudomonas spirodelae TaxID=3101751 RepID=A0ABU5P9G2_9PSED|nr:TerB family tellurite resistance protein [Pseudomonas sp. T5W1]MEA1606301.1 TerB family tellurite resistance protein [Pseudomonas sp. T5W1]